MDTLEVAVVCVEPALRMVCANAFDAAPAHWNVTLHTDAPPQADVVVSAGRDIPNAIPFDLHDPVATIEQIELAACRLRSSSIAVLGSTGGCGATSVALHLAAEGAARTCFVEATDRPAVASRLGLNEVDLAGDPVHVSPGFQLAAVREPAEGTDRAVGALRRRFDHLVIDVSTARLSQVLPHAEVAVLVLAPTEPSAIAAADLLKRWENVRWAIVSNRVGPGGETVRSELEHLLGRRLTMELPCSPGLRDAEGEHRLLTTPWSPWRMRVARLAKAVTQA